MPLGNGRMTEPNIFVKESPHSLPIPCHKVTHVDYLLRNCFNNFSNFDFIKNTKAAPKVIISYWNYKLAVFLVGNMAIYIII